MRKFWSFFTICLSDALVYRATSFIWMLLDISPAVIALIFWFAAFQNKPVIAGYTLSSIFFYYLGVMLIKNVVATHPQYKLSEEIRTGDFSNYLLKPINLVNFKIASNFAWRTTRLIFLTPLLLILIFSFNHLLPQFNFHLFQIGALIISLILAVFLNFFLKMSLGLSTIWFIESEWLFFGFQLLISFFSGELIPLNLFPQNLLFIADLLPFKYVLSFPLSLALNRLQGPQQIIIGLTIQLSWSLFAYWLYRQVFKRGAKIYSAYGG